MLRERSSDILSLVEHLVYKIFEMYSVLVLLSYSMGKINSFWKFLMLCERDSGIASFVEHPVHNIFKLLVVLILLYLF